LHLVTARFIALITSGRWSNCALSGDQN